MLNATSRSTLVVRVVCQYTCAPLHINAAGGLALTAPLHLTWSCYQRDDLACGRCTSCRMRLAGFRRAGASDPLPYASIPRS